MKFSRLITSSLTACLAAALPQHSNWPDGPFKTSGPNIIDASGNTVVYAGVNWPGAADVMIPEGLQYASISFIVSAIKSLGMNAVRLTYAIEMIDDILSPSSGDVSLSTALSIALGPANATTVLAQIIQHNPTFTANTTRLQVFDAVAAELAAQHVYLHLDNHMSRGAWCCSLTDGNGWFGDTDFDVAKWKRGLAFMADHAGRNWPAMTSMSLRNELRQVENDTAVNATYGWGKWYEEMTNAAEGIHGANGDTLIFFSGLDYDHTLGPVVRGEELDGEGTVFRKGDFAYGDKIVWELHSYDNSATDCAELQADLYERGFDALDTSGTGDAVNVAPVVLTEFGFEQNATDYQSVYAQCLKGFVTGEGREGEEPQRLKGKIGWMQWVVAGSYYIRSGTQDYDETWGLFNHEWTAWREEMVVQDYTTAMVQGTLG
jgi:hypothetical protein